PVTERDIPASIRLVGTVLPERRAVVASEMSGIVLESPQSEGKFLRAGDALCRLDRQLAQMRLDEAEAELGALRAKLEELENGTRVEILRKQEAVVDEAQAMV